MNHSAPLRQQFAKQLGETHVVADGQAEPAGGGIDGDGLRAGAHAARLTVAFGLAGHVDVEEVDLVVARNGAARVVVDEAGGGDARFAGELQRHRAGHDPQTQPARLLGDEVLDRSRTRRFGNGELGGFAHPHEREVLGQHHDCSALLAGLLQQVSCNGEVARDVGARGHLDGGYAGQGGFPVGGRCCAPALLSSPAGAEIRLTTGAAQGPLTW